LSPAYNETFVAACAFLNKGIIFHLSSAAALLLLLLKHCAAVTLTEGSLRRFPTTFQIVMYANQFEARFEALKLHIFLWGNAFK